MTRKKHAPGPWQISGKVKSQRHDEIEVVAITTPHSDGGGQTIAECLANCAPLIAAAPETAAERDKLKEDNVKLLEACKWALHCLKIECVKSGAISTLEDAISKPKGK